MIFWYQFGLARHFFFFPFLLFRWIESCQIPGWLGDPIPVKLGKVVPASFLPLPVFLLAQLHPTTTPLSVPHQKNIQSSCLLALAG